ncbi:MAG: cupin domain-containing protein [Actinomycetota bacterium]
MDLKGGNLLADLPAGGAEEDFATLLAGTGFRLLRIVSLGHATPAGQWYDQSDDEWVMVVSGRAGLRIEGEAAERRLGPGDWVLLPAGLRHRVEWTDADRPTVWLALHAAPASQL